MKRSVSILLTVCLVLSLLTTSVLAAESAGDTKGGQATENSENVQGGLAAGKGEDWQEVLDDQKVAEQENGISPQADDILVTDKYYYEDNSVDIWVNADPSGSWVGLYPADTTSYGTSIAWFNCTSGWVSLRTGEGVTWNQSKSLGGAYKVVLFGDSGYSNVLETRYVFVGNVTLETDKDQYYVCEPIYVTTNYAQFEGWVGMRKSTVAAGDGAAVAWYYPMYVNEGDPGLSLKNANLMGSHALANHYPHGKSAIVPGTYVIAVYEHDFGDTAYHEIKTKTITIKDHPYKNTVTAPTCTAQGYTTHTCSVCGHSYKDTYTSPKGHTYNQQKTTSTYLKSAATCTSPAVYYYSCTCGATGTSTFTSGSALAHTYNQQKTTSTYLKTAATCTSAAVYYYSCTCGATGTTTFTSGSAKGHSYTSAVTAPTCTAVGYTTYTCSVCQDSYTGNETAALGHTETTVNASEPDCENPGYTGDTVCSVCDTKIAAGSEIPALGHDYVATVTPPTCTEAGYTTYVCSRDSSHTYTDAAVPATGHTWGEYTLTKAPTHTETGEMTKSCTVCGAVHADVITVMKTPLMDLQIEFVNGRLVLTGIYDDYTNKTSYLSVLTHGIVLIPTASEGSAELSVNTNGRTKIEFNGFKTDGTVRYTFTPAGADVSYTVRAFVSYADPVTGEQVFAYSDILTGDYTTNQGRTLTTVRAD